MASRPGGSIKVRLREAPVSATGNPDLFRAAESGQLETFDKRRKSSTIGVHPPNITRGSITSA
jgi:hypothetical protein